MKMVITMGLVVAGMLVFAQGARPQNAAPRPAPASPVVSRAWRGRPTATC